MFPGRAGAEVRARDQHGGPGVLRLIEDEVAIVPPFREQAGAEAGALDALQPVAWNDLVGVDVAAVERYGGSIDHANGFHHNSPGVAKWPATAVAAATAGDTRWVRPPRP